jgi:hypothetical protein
VPYVIAASLSALVALVEFRTRLASRPTLRGGAWLWWIGRLGLDAAIGIAAVTVIGSSGRPEWLTGVVAGLAGASFVRWQVAIPGEGATTREFGVAKAYDPLRNYFERTLTEIGAVEQGRWIQEVVLPQFRGAGMSVDDVANRLRWYIEASGLDDGTKAATRGFIDATVVDTIAEDKRIEVLLLHTINELRGYRMVKGLVHSSKKQMRSGRAGALSRR